MMKKFLTLLSVAVLASGLHAFGGVTLDMVPAAKAKIAANVPSTDMVINGTGTIETITVNASNLPGDITVKATAGLKVYPTKIKANAGETTVYVTLLSTLPETTGQVILRSGDVRAYVNVTGYGSALEQKDLSLSPVFTPSETPTTIFAKGTAEGFTPLSKGYTVEFKMKNYSDADYIDAYAVTPNAGTFRAYVDGSGLGFYNGSSKIAVSNPAGKTFYNNDGQFHTYRIAVTSDQRLFVYRDGNLVSILRADDYGHQRDWLGEPTEIVENLLKNPGFEGEFNAREDGLINRVQGWHVDPIDQYNCTYTVPNREINNELDADNHVMKLQRYNWNDGWGAGTVSQIVDVAPNTTYSLTCLAGGGMNTKTGEIMSSIRIEEVQNSKAGTKAEVTNETGFEPYALNYTTSADCDQIKVILYNERFVNGGGWGSSPKEFLIDEMVLTGHGRQLDEKVGFELSSKRTELAYFTYDVTGAYAPLLPVLAPAVDSLAINGTGAEANVKVSIANIAATDPITVTATPGFKVSPETLSASEDGEITITNLSTLPLTEGTVIIRCGDMRSYIKVTGIGSELERKDLSTNPTYVPEAGDAREFTANKADGFDPTSENGYTIEFRARTSSSTQSIDVYGVTTDGASFSAYVDSEGMGVYNRLSPIAFSNPATAATGGAQKFYNNDGNYHTYRFAVTPDQRIFAYRDGLQVANVRAADYANRPDWAVADGEIVKNLLKNPGFEGEFNARESDGLINRVEGWILDPIDQYNCSYSVPQREINKDLTPDNHVMKLQRYNWNDGWGAGTVSQVVNVSPNSTYTLTCLASGGMNTKTGEIMSSIRIEEAQDSKASSKVEVTNDGDMETYSLTYTTSADCNQLKVILYNERFLNGGGWGSSPKEFLVDEMTLTGMSRVLDQKVGYKASTKRIDMEYFTYDATGAYAPLEPSFGDSFTSVESIAADPNNAVSVLIDGNRLFVRNAAENVTVSVYNSVGQQVAVSKGYRGEGILLPSQGVYLCKVALAAQQRTFKVIY